MKTRVAREAARPRSGVWAKPFQRRVPSAAFGLGFTAARGETARASTFRRRAIYHHDAPRHKRYFVRVWEICKSPELD